MSRCWQWSADYLFEKRQALDNTRRPRISSREHEGTAWDATTYLAMIGARALDLFEKAYADRDPNIPYLSCMPSFDPLRAEPRFQALLRRMNLPQ